MPKMPKKSGKGLIQVHWSLGGKAWRKTWSPHPVTLIAACCLLALLIANLPFAALTLGIGAALGYAARVQRIPADRRSVATAGPVGAIGPTGLTDPTDRTTGPDGPAGVPGTTGPTNAVLITTEDGQVRRVLTANKEIA